MTDGRATIADVATQAGVSVSTVSKVINDRYGVSEETSARVRAVIEHLGYRSSLVAQSLRSRRTNVIGVLATDIEPFNAELLKGVARGIRGTGYDLVVFSDCGQGSDQIGWEAHYLARVSTLTDGAILVTPTTVELNQRIPLVAVDHNTAAANLTCIDSDNVNGALAATEHLIGLGHTRIAFLGGRSDLASASHREKGYRQALAVAGIEAEESLIRNGGYEPTTAREAAQAVLALVPRPTALFAANDVMAIEAMRIAQGNGLSVPDDLSVVGFDNVPESALSTPTLTTIDQSIQLMGSIAVRSLIDLINDPLKQPRQVTLPTRLVVRESSRQVGHYA